ncbi:DUF3299 domain-containing protein [Silanimonas algicola]
MSIRVFRCFAAAVLSAALLSPVPVAAQEPAIGARPSTDGLPRSDVREIDWLELLPPEDLKALEEMPEIDHEGQMQMPQVMSSTKTVAAMDGVKGKVPGYLVPIAFDDQQRVTEMFLVPYFGACVHVPPPPPNQLIYIKPENPIELGNLWDAYWVHGTVRASLVENAMATSAYAMELDRLELIEE